MTGAIRRSRHGRSDRCPGNPIIVIHQSVTQFDTFALAYYVSPESTADPSGAGVCVSVGAAVVGVSVGIAIVAVSVGTGVSVAGSIVGVPAGVVTVGSTVLVAEVVGVGTTAASMVRGSRTVVP